MRLNKLNDTIRKYSDRTEYNRFYKVIVFCILNKQLKQRFLNNWKDLKNSWDVTAHLAIIASSLAVIMILHLCGRLSIF